MPVRTICIIGGTFDPIHLGHLQMARSAQAHCLADEVWFMPAGDPWQKAGKVIGTAKERLHMVALAIEGVHSWRTENIEAQRSEPTFTANTLQLLCERHPDDSYVFVVGGDQVSNLTTWKNWRSLFDFARIGVVDRPQTGDMQFSDELQPYLHTDALFRIPMPEVNITSTQLRRQFELLDSPQAELREHAQHKLENSLPKPVWRYLKTNPIYSRPRA